VLKRAFNLMLQSCTRKRGRMRPSTITAVERIVNEVAFLASPSDTSYPVFLERNMDEISETISRHQQHFGYVTFLHIT